MPSEGSLVIPDDLVGERLDRAIKVMLDRDGDTVSVREIRNALRDGSIVLPGAQHAPGDPVVGGLVIDVRGFRSRAAYRIVGDARLAERIRVLFEDDSLLVVDKPSGIHTTPLRSDSAGTLLHAAVAIAPEIADAGPAFEGGAVHRLDRPTSGVVVFAKNRETRSALRAAFRAHEVTKTYAAIVRVEGDDWIVGTIRRIDEPIRHAGHKVRVGPHADAQPATSTVHVEAIHAQSAYVTVTTQFGRRHQVRAHLAHAGAPILGDELYAGPALTDSDRGRIALHAHELRLAPGRMFEAPLPEDFVGWCKVLALR